MDFPQSVAADWPDLLEIVARLVKGTRGSHSTAHWWQFERRRSELYRAIKGLHNVFAILFTSPHMAVTALPNGPVFANSLNIFAFSDFSFFSVLQVRVHEVWARCFASTLEDRLRYTPSDCFRTFAYPTFHETMPALETLGCAYHDHRAALMVARNEGLTKTYNRFHDRAETSGDIQRLRELHAAMDRAVLDAYGWQDLAARAEPIFLDETNEDDHTYQGRLFWPSDFRDQVLARLLALNAERHAEELRIGIAPGMKGRKQGDDEEYEEE